MCGIGGFESSDMDSERAARLRASLAHRGPDADSWGVHGGHVLIQTRLAVIDLSDRVTYPMGNETGDVWLTFNGEIYDHHLLRTQLEGLGQTFETRCDSEVVVHAFEEWDIEAFSRLNGMFALAIVDERDGRVVLARDEFGIKPLCHTTGASFAWSSDAVSLVEAGLADARFSEDDIGEFAGFHYVPPPHTGLTSVTQLPPGTVLTRDREGRTRSVRFSASRADTVEHHDSSPVERVDAALSAAVGRQLVADVDVGVLLSSGIDSALLLSYATEAGASPAAFTLAFPGAGNYDETAMAARVASFFGVAHEVESFDSTFSDALLGVSSAFDQPFADASSIATLQLASLARSGSTVVLSGTGGDEQFGGYNRLRAHRLRGVARIIASLGQAGGESGGRGVERRSAQALRSSYLRRLASCDNTSPDTQYMSLVGSSTTAIGLAALRMPISAGRARAAVAARHLPTNGGEASLLRRYMDFDRRSYLAGDVLAKEDRASMSVGLEARVPFLDAEVTRAGLSMGDGDLVSLRKGKLVLRELARRRLSPDLVRSGKRGFAVPLDQLLRGPWLPESIDWFDGAESELVDTDRVRQGLRASVLAAPDVWALGCPVSWEARINAACAAAPGLARGSR